MYINVNRVKIIITLPAENVSEVRDAICVSGAGIIGEYSCCSTVTKCVGTFKPNGNSNPYIGKIDNLEIIDEEKLEVVCDVRRVKRVLAKIRKVHPYEEPAIDIIPLMDEDNFK